MKLIMHAGAIVAVAALTGCFATGLPEGSGKGMLTFDREPPPGAQVFERPEWQVGDRFVYRRGGAMRVAYEVAERTDAGYVLAHDDSPVRTMWTLDLAQAGMEIDGNPLASRREEPPEPLLHWPMWVGKRWSCDLLHKQAGADPVPLEVTFHCDASETVTVLAGTFMCLRIWRRARVTAAGRYLEKTSLLWYSPEVGNFVQRLENNHLLELMEYHRQ